MFKCPIIGYKQCGNCKNTDGFLYVQDPVKVYCRKDSEYHIINDTCPYHEEDEKFIKHE